MKNGAEKNDLLERLSRDKSFGVSLDGLKDVLEARRFVGRAPEQVDEFLRDVIEPLLAWHRAPAAIAEEIRV